VSDLDKLLQTARDAAPWERIEFRDPIAAHGSTAIGPVASWLTEPGLGGFAVRVLARIAQDNEHRSAVVDALAGADRDRMSSTVAQDVSEAVAQLLGPSGAPTKGARPKTPDWPGQRSVTSLELRFHEAMLDIYRVVGEATRRRRLDGTFQRGYWATYFLRGVRNHGGPDYARQLLRLEGTSSGFERLVEEGRVDLSVEALVLRPEFAPLFTEDERATASRRLRGRVASVESRP